MKTNAASRFPRWSCGAVTLLWYYCGFRQNFPLQLMESPWDHLGQAEPPMTKRIAK